MPPQLRTTVFAFNRCIETSISQVAAKLVALMATRAFHFQDNLEAAVADPVGSESRLANVNALEASYLEAARAALDATGAVVEQAYADARAARAAVDAAYQGAKDIVEKIRLVGSLARKASALVKVAGGA